MSWFGPAGPVAGVVGSEWVIQAISGLMGVNGRDDGRPVPIGLPVASVAAGVLAAQAVLATLVGKVRGRPAQVVRTSVLQAGLLLCSHYIAAATSGEDPWPATPAPAPGPPFLSLDNRWFEIETLDPEAWRMFWRCLGLGDADLGRAWTSFRARYFQGACCLPTGFHEATAARPLAELLSVACSCGVSLCPLRSYAEVSGDLGPLDAYPDYKSLGGVRVDGTTPTRSSRPVLSSPGFGGTEAPGDGELPLDGLIVVEVTTRMQGPLAGLLLGMLGAKVVKVEPPGGDIGRMMPPMAGDSGTFFSCWNRGKESVELDLAASSGRRQLVQLASEADVFLHNWRPGRAEQWALAPYDLARVNPRLVYVQASGWGSRPQPAQLLGTDYLVQASSGMSYGLWPPSEPPRTTRLLLTDFMGALVTCEGALGGLYRREREGEAQLVGTSLLAGAATLQAEVLDGIRAGAEIGRADGRPLWSALDMPIGTVDGAALAVGQLDEDSFDDLCRVCGVANGRADRAHLEQLVAKRIGGGESGEWQERLAAAGIPAAVVRVDLAGLAKDSRMAGLLEPLGGTSCAPAIPWRFYR